MWETNKRIILAFLKNLPILSAKPAQKTTPLMKQYNAIKAKYPDALLLFRVGDFYETFGEDAIRTARILNIETMGANAPNWQVFHIIRSIPIFPN